MWPDSHVLPSGSHASGTRRLLNGMRLGSPGARLYISAPAHGTRLISTSATQSSAIRSPWSRTTTGREALPRPTPPPTSALLHAVRLGDPSSSQLQPLHPAATSSLLLHPQQVLAPPPPHMFQYPPQVLAPPAPLRRTCSRPRRKCSRLRRRTCSSPRRKCSPRRPRRPTCGCCHTRTSSGHRAPGTSRPYTPHPSA